MTLNDVQVEFRDLQDRRDHLEVELRKTNAKMALLIREMAKLNEAELKQISGGA